MGNFDYINCRGIDHVKRLNLYPIRRRRDYFLMTLMFKAIPEISLHCLSDRIDMHFDIHGYHTREAGSMNVFFMLSTKRYIEIVFSNRVVNFGMNCQIL